MTITALRVLLMEDNPGDVRLIREMLLNDRRQPINLDHRGTLREGLAQLEANTYDAILLDLSLPDSQGLATLNKVGAATNTAIVVLTGLNDGEMGVQAVQQGAQDYLPKDEVDSKLLMRALRYAVERHRVEAIIRQREQEYRSLIDDVFNTSMVAVLILDRQYRVVWCNEATEIYFGITRERLLGRDKRHLIDDELKCVFADPDGYAGRLLSAYEAGDFTDRFECHVMVDVGRNERWLEHWSQPIRDGMYAGGRIEQYTDITERKLLEFAEAEQRGFVEALQDISGMLVSTLDLNEVLGGMLRSVGRVVPHDSASIVMLEGDQVSVVHHRRDLNGGDPELVTEKQKQAPYPVYLEMMMSTGKPVIVPDVAQGISAASALNGVQRGYVGAPVRLQEEVIGFVNLFSTEPGYFINTHAERLMAFAELAAIAIQNARLYKESQQLAAIEERHRLARDLHDSVSQTLFTCRTMAESAMRRWHKNPARAYQLVEEVYRLTATALAEMRILLLELRPASLTRVSLKQLFEQYLRPIQDRHQYRLQLAIDDIPPLPPDVQIALYRIVQEALNNIDKHARATQVIVSVTNREDCVTMQVNDNGEGFEPEIVQGTSLGLGIIQERAEQIGAKLEIHSHRGEGTRITVSWQKT